MKPFCQSVLPICQYGGYCGKDSDCYAGNYCRLDQLPYYTQCLPKPSTYKSSNCLANFYGNNQQCSSDTDCCDPGAFCNDLVFRQCQQPAIGSPVCSNPSKFRDNTDCFIELSVKPTFKLTIVPTSKPTIKPTIIPSNVRTSFLSKEPSFQPSNAPTNPATLSVPSFFPLSPTQQPSNTLTEIPSLKPIILPSITRNPTFSGAVIVSFFSGINLQFVDCDALRYCFSCQRAIELSQQQIINATLHVLANVTYVQCIVGRRRKLYSGGSRNLAISANVTIITTFKSNQPSKDSDAAKLALEDSIKTQKYTQTLRTNTLKLNATATQNALIRALSNGATTIRTFSPSKTPTDSPSVSSTDRPSTSPTSEKVPSLKPITQSPSKIPTQRPSSSTTKNPTTNVPTQKPSKAPTIKPSDVPTQKPSKAPTIKPSDVPTQKPSKAPTIKPSDVPTQKPSKAPTIKPSDVPTQKPSKAPTIKPSDVPTQKPSKAPTIKPSDVPTQKPSAIPSETPTEIPTTDPTETSTDFPTLTPSVGCLVIQTTNITDQYTSDGSITCLTVSSTVTSIGIIIFMNFNNW